MVIGIKDIRKLFVISVIACCAVFVCALFINYNMDLTGIEGEIGPGQTRVIYDAQIMTGKVTAIISGSCLAATSIVLLLFFIKNYIDTHGKELGILKALGYSNLEVAKHFWSFGFSVLIGCGAGYLGAALYMPAFYEAQNKEKYFPDIVPEFHFGIFLYLVLLPAAFFMILSVFYAYFRMKRPVLHLLKDIRETKSKIRKKEMENLPFLQDLRNNTLRSRKILVFFIGFSAYCFSAMTQMSMSMKELASENFAWIMVTIGLILAFMILFLSLSSVMRANTKTIAMMKVFGYSKQECAKALLGGYRPVSYVGFVLGTVYQYALLKIVVTVVFADFADMPEFHFNWKALLVSLPLFILAYEFILALYAKEIEKVPIKEIMLE